MLRTWKKLGRLFAALFLASGILASCASKSIEIKTIPDGATIKNAGGEILGESPLILSGEASKKILDSASFASFWIEKVNFEKILLKVELHHQDRFEIKLQQQNEERFKSDVIGAYSVPLHGIFSTLLLAQGALLAKRFEEAGRLVAELQRSYPTLAAAFVIEADLLLAQGQRVRAVDALRAAYRIAPDDARIVQGLKQLGASPTSASAAAPPPGGAP